MTVRLDRIVLFLPLVFTEKSILKEIEVGLETTVRNQSREAGPEVLADKKTSVFVARRFNVKR